MSLAQLEVLFGKIAVHYAASGTSMDFVWHGGEPLLQPTDYYRGILDLQKATLGKSGIPYTNSIQTNLTLLNDDNLALLREGVFHHIGVSLDLVGEHRLTTRGAPTDARVIANIDRLRREGIRFGVIVVLSRSTAPVAGDIFSFLHGLSISHRFLPIYRAAFQGQQAELALSHAEVIDALCDIAQRWVRTGLTGKVEPLSSYLNNLLRLAYGQPAVYYDREHSESIKIVDTNGFIYSNADAYEPELAHVNVFEESLAAVVTSAGWLRSLGQSRRRVSDACSDCSFWGSCSGFFMAEATTFERYRDDNGTTRCVIARTMQRRLLEIIRG